MLENDHKVLRYAATMVIQRLLKFLFFCPCHFQAKIWMEVNSWSVSLLIIVFNLYS